MCVINYNFCVIVVVIYFLNNCVTVTVGQLCSDQCNYKTQREHLMGGFKLTMGLSFNTHANPNSS